LRYVSARKKLADHILGTEVDAGQILHWLHPLKQKFSGAEIHEAIGFAHHFVIPAWASEAASRLIMARDNLPQIALERKKDGFESGAKIFQLFSQKLHLGGELYLQPSFHSGGETPFRLSVVHDLPRSHPELLKRTWHDQPDGFIADVAFDVHKFRPNGLKSLGAPHLVVFGVQARRVKKKEELKIVRKKGTPVQPVDLLFDRFVNEAFPSEGEFADLSPRAKIVLAVEQLCREHGIGFAVANPKTNSGLSKERSTPQASHAFTTRAIQAHWNVIREMELVPIKAGRYYVRA